MITDCFGNASAKCELKLNESLGRYVAAARDLRAGELLLLEQPAIVGPYWDSKICCLCCYADSAKICMKCKIAPLCFACKAHDPFECEFLRVSGVPENFLIDHFDLITPLRCIMLARDPERRSVLEVVLQMQSHSDERRETAIWRIHAEKVIRPLCAAKGFLVNDVETDEWLQTMCGILDVNTFEVRTPNSKEIPVRGLYPRAALLAHNCVANTFITLDAGMTMRIYASQEIRAGGTIYNNYTSTIFGTVARQEHLREGKYFSCNCARCLDPTELGTHFSSLLCADCQSLIMPPHFAAGGKWKCSCCSKTKTNDDVQQILCLARLDIISAGIDVALLETFIKTYSVKLNPNHYLVVEMKQKLAAILRSICDSGNFQPLRAAGEAIIQRKMELCRDILPVLKVLQPGLSRMTAIAMFEYFISLLDLSQIHNAHKLFTAKQYLDRLVEIESIAKESIAMLIYEPPSTPEGQLAKHAMVRLKFVRNAIDKQQKLMRKDERKAGRGNGP